MNTDRRKMTIGDIANWAYRILTGLILIGGLTSGYVRFTERVEQNANNIAANDIKNNEMHAAINTRLDKIENLLYNQNGTLQEIKGSLHRIETK